MADIDPKLIGQIISSIPYDQAFGSPLAAAIDAQTKAAKTSLDFILAVGFSKTTDDKGIEIQKTNYAEFQFEEKDESGIQRIRSLRVPLLLLVNIPQVEIFEGEISFDLEISQTATMKDHVAAGGELEGKIGWGPFSLGLKAKASYDKDRTRSTDTRAKQHVLMKVKQAEPPEALNVMLEIMKNAALGAESGKNQKEIINQAAPAIAAPAAAPAEPAAHGDSE